MVTVISFCYYDDNCLCVITVLLINKIVEISGKGHVQINPRSDQLGALIS